MLSKRLHKNSTKNEVDLFLYQDFDAVCRWDSYDSSRYGESSINKLVEMIEVGEWVKCDAGEDHDLNYQNRFNRMVDVVESSPVKFKIYEDPDAHTTYYTGLVFPE